MTSFRSLASIPSDLMNTLCSPSESVTPSRIATQNKPRQLYRTSKETFYTPRLSRIFKEFCIQPSQKHNYLRIYYNLPRKLDFLGWFNRNRVLSELTEHRINWLESTINLLSNFCAGKNNFTRYKDQEYDLRVNHPVNQTREQFWFVLSLVISQGEFGGKVQMRTFRANTPNPRDGWEIWRHNFLRYSGF